MDLRTRGTWAIAARKFPYAVRNAWITAQVSFGCSLYPSISQERERERELYLYPAALSIGSLITPLNPRCPSLSLSLQTLAMI